MWEWCPALPPVNSVIYKLPDPDKKDHRCWEWWHMPVGPVTQRWRQEDYELKTSLGKAIETLP
jgi:hypothetical protein